PRGRRQRLRLAGADHHRRLGAAAGVVGHSEVRPRRRLGGTRGDREATDRRGPVRGGPSALQSVSTPSAPRRAPLVSRTATPSGIASEVYSPWLVSRITRSALATARSATRWISRPATVQEGTCGSW